MNGRPVHEELISALEAFLNENPQLRSAILDVLRDLRRAGADGFLRLSKGEIFVVSNINLEEAQVPAFVTLMSMSDRTIEFILIGDKFENVPIRILLNVSEDELIFVPEIGLWRIP